MKKVVFKYPFRLSPFDGALPAGEYSIKIVEELIEAGPVSGYRHVSTAIILDPAHPGSGTSKMLAIDARELEYALIADIQTPSEFGRFRT